MINCMKKCIFVLFLCLSAMNIMAQSESQTEYNFLRLPVSAHVAAAGGDNITLVENDATLMFSNPALLLGVTPKTVSLSYMNYMSGCNCAAASYNMVVNEKWNIGIGAQYMNYGKMKETDAAGTNLGTFTANDVAFSGTLAYELFNNISGGITARYIIGTIGGYTSLGFGVDLGVNYYNAEKECSVSAVVKNLGGQIKAYDDNFEKMPLDIQVGVSKRLIGSPLRLTATLVDLNHWGYKFIDHLAAGVDIILSPQIYVSGGYNFRRAHEMSVLNADGDKTSKMAGLSLGAGLMLDRFKVNLAYSKFHVSSSSLMLNLAFAL